MDTNKNHTDRIGRRVHVGGVVTHRVSRQSGVVLGAWSKTQIEVSLDNGKTAVWYTDSTML